MSRIEAADKYVESRIKQYDCVFNGFSRLHMEFLEALIYNAYMTGAINELEIGDGLKRDIAKAKAKAEGRGRGRDD